MELSCWCTMLEQRIERTSQAQAEEDERKESESRVYLLADSVGLD